MSKTGDEKFSGGTKLMVKKLALIAVVALAGALLSVPAFATPVVAAQAYGGTAPFTLLALGTGTAGTEIGTSTIAVSGETISFSGGASEPTTGYTNGVYAGNIGGAVASPFGGGTTEYIAAQPTGTVTINFSSVQTAFDLLWGSIDTDTTIQNNLAFYSGANGTGSLLYSISGAQLEALVGGLTSGVSTDYVEISNIGNFSSIIATDPAAYSAFEFVPGVPVPEAGTLGMLGAGLIGLIALVGFRRRNAISC
ncbi:MAG: PEP-CTERM sorting domain-containing protein [Candidatus Acidiferrales bacterium]|jgi:hypothetical protein